MFLHSSFYSQMGCSFHFFQALDLFGYFGFKGFFSFFLPLRFEIM